MGCGEIEDTEAIDEALVLNSSLLETPFQVLYDDTELVDNGNCGDEESLNQECYGLDQVVVDDSDDEDGSVAAGEPMCLPELSPKAGDILLESDGSNDHECQTGKHILVLLCCLYLLLCINSDKSYYISFFKASKNQIVIQ